MSTKKVPFASQESSATVHHTNNNKFAQDNTNETFPWDNYLEAPLPVKVSKPKKSRRS